MPTSKNKKQKDDILLRRGLVIVSIIAVLILLVIAFIVYSNHEAPKAQEKAQYLAAERSINTLAYQLSEKGYGKWSAQKGCRYETRVKVDFAPDTWLCTVEARSPLGVATLKTESEEIEDYLFKDDAFVDRDEIKNDLNDIDFTRPYQTLLKIEMKESDSSLRCIYAVDIEEAKPVARVLCEGSALGSWYPEKH